MENKKLISVRMEERTLREIEKITRERSYWKRSDVICNLLSAVFANFTPFQIYNMMQIWLWERQEVDAKFEITDKMLTHSKLLHGKD